MFRADFVRCVDNRRSIIHGLYISTCWCINIPEVSPAARRSTSSMKSEYTFVCCFSGRLFDSFNNLRNLLIHSSKTLKFALKVSRIITIQAFFIFLCHETIHSLRFSAQPSYSVTRRKHKSTNAVIHVYKPLPAPPFIVRLRKFCPLLQTGLSSGSSEG